MQTETKLSSVPKSSVPVAPKSWFDEALKTLQVNEIPGWPDQFGTAISKWFIKNNHEQISTLSLFTGAGGLDIGFHDSGFHAQEMVEIEKKFVDTLVENTSPQKYFSGSHAKCIDIREYNPSDKIKVDFIIGGPPCQTFSSAGRRASGVMGTDDPRGMLFAEYVRLLKKLQPKGFLFENVYGITGAQGGKAWEDIKQAFQNAGYKIFYRVLDAADYGVPQHRERLFIVGLKSGEFKFPYPTHGPDSEDQRPHYTAGEAVTGVVSDEPRKKINGRYGHLLDDIPAGLNYSFYTKKLGHPNPVFAWRSKFSDFLYKADPKSPVRAIKAQGGQYTGPFSWENRYFTVAELKRLQTFPDAFDLVGGRQVAIHQIGNSVPPQIGRIMGLAILDQVFGVKLPFEIKYLSDDQALSFRNRKRQKTDIYAKNAKEGHKALLLSKKIVHKNGTARLTRYLGPNFEWRDKPSQGYRSAEILKKIASDSMTLTVGGRKRRRFAITIRPADSSDWDLPYKQISLVSEGCEKVHLTFLWKALEEEVKSQFGFADLVQLSGYYQYSPRIKAIFYHNSAKSEEDFWSLLQTILESNGAFEIDLKRPTLFEFKNVTGTETVLRELKSLGYEIRNRNTNPQIREGVYLIPYIFPTLTRDSVQLRKHL